MAASVKHLDETCEILLASMEWPDIYAGPEPTHSGTCQSGSTSATVKLDTGASAVTGAYKGQRVGITGGTGVGQARNITAYDGATRVGTIDSAWSITPDNTSTFTVVDARRFAIQNVGDRTMQNVIVTAKAVGLNDGITYAQIGADIAAIIPPYNLSISLGATADGGTWGSVGFKYYRIIAKNATGKTVGSVEISVYVDDTTKRITLNWDQVVGATDYEVYRSETAGVYTTPALRATLSGGSTISYIDNGAAVSAGALPTANLSGGPAPLYGTPPTFVASPLAVGNLKPGQMFIFWVNWSIPSNVAETADSRQFLISVREG